MFGVFVERQKPLFISSGDLDTWNVESFIECLFFSSISFYDIRLSQDRIKGLLLLLVINAYNPLYTN